MRTHYTIIILAQTYLKCYKISVKTSFLHEKLLLLISNLKIRASWHNSAVNEYTIYYLLAFSFSVCYYFDTYCICCFGFLFVVKTVFFLFCKVLVSTLTYLRMSEAYRCVFGPRLFRIYTNNGRQVSQ